MTCDAASTPSRGSSAANAFSPWSEHDRSHPHVPRAAGSEPVGRRGGGRAIAGDAVCSTLHEPAHAPRPAGAPPFTPARAPKHYGAPYEAGNAF
jgi:hypothetical protein